MILSLILAAWLSAAPPVPARVATLPAADSISETYTPHRVYDTRRRRFIDLESMLAALVYSDAIFLGEQHDDPGTHRLEAATLEGLTRRRGNIVLALEMFERDVQGSLNDYLAGRMSEESFLASARPWARYRSDYRPMVEFAKRYRWPVVAGNVPRRLASYVGRRGIAGLDTLNAADRALVAHELNCPRDGYFERFEKTVGDMAGHGSNGKELDAGEKRLMLERIYEAQCAKDETMGESVATALAAAPPRALVVHVNGSFHSDYGLGTAERAKQRLRGKQVAVVSFVPVHDLDAADGNALRRLADYVVFTLAAGKAAAAP
jgi:uncharacterized iron-regulated protein